MPSKSKIKGNSFEREIVNLAKSIGLDAKRSYASDGRSLGESEKVDLVICGVTVQAKRRAKIASYMKIPDDVDIVIIREDRGEPIAVVRLDKILKMIQEGRWN
jgi:Holliday junction resolvase